LSLFARTVRESGTVRTASLSRIALALTGCAGLACARPSPEAQFASSTKLAALPPKLRDPVRAILAERCGSPDAPRLLGESKGASAHLRAGADVYRRYCRQCHGVSGDGDGPVAAYLLPRPRDYRAGIFKFTSTTYGSKPLREDLVRTVRRGIRGTSMPAFPLLPKPDVESVVEYVVALAQRGELETQLAEEAESSEAVDAQAVPALVEVIHGKWKDARAQVVFPMTPMPELTAAHVEAGKSAFLSRGCAQCHGDDGRGQTKENIGVDAWGFPTKAADLTSGMLRGGTEPLDIYRHVDAGINGTPMPSFHANLQQEPETVWNLVAYVLYLADRRRTGAIPDAGPLKPLPGVAHVRRASPNTATVRSARPPWRTDPAAFSTAGLPRG
jgi:mono/diheme cytochrome c family protein